MFVCDRIRVKWRDSKPEERKKDAGERERGFLALKGSCPNVSAPSVGGWTLIKWLNGVFKVTNNLCTLESKS